MKKEKLIYEEPEMLIISFDESVMGISGTDWSQWDQDGDGWTDGWV